jgi:hypothetical protein
MKKRLEILKSKKYPAASELRNALKSNSELRQEIETLTKHFLGRSVSGCGNCHFDAYMDLINLKKMNETKFKVKHGAVLYDPVNQDLNKVLTANNCTDELAIYHLKHNPGSRKYFSVLSENVDELIAGLGNPEESDEPTEEEKAVIEAIKQAIASGVALKEIKEGLREKGLTVRKADALVKLAKAE